MKKIAADRNYKVFKKAERIMDDELGLRLDQIATELVQLANDNKEHPLAETAQTAYETIANAITKHFQPVEWLDTHGR